jgi:hypothetical protein
MAIDKDNSSVQEFCVFNGFVEDDAGMLRPVDRQQDFFMAHDISPCGLKSCAYQNIDWSIETLVERV